MLPGCQTPSSTTLITLAFKRCTATLVTVVRRAPQPELRSSTDCGECLITPPCFLSFWSLGGFSGLR